MSILIFIPPKPSGTGMYVLPEADIRHILAPQSIISNLNAKSFLLWFNRSLNKMQFIVLIVKMRLNLTQLQ